MHTRLGSALGVLLAASCLCAKMAAADALIVASGTKHTLSTLVAPAQTARATRAAARAAGPAQQQLAASATWEPCGASGQLMTVSSVHLWPSPPARSVPMQVRINGTMQTALTAGDVVVSVSYHSFKVGYSAPGLVTQDFRLMPN